MTESIECFEFGTECARLQYARGLIDDISFINVVGKAFGMLICQKHSGQLQFTCPVQIHFVTAVLNRPCKECIFPILRIIAGVCLNNLVFVQEAITIQRFFNGVFNYMIGNDNMRRPIACHLIEIAGVDFMIEIANKHNFVINCVILEHAIMYLSMEIICKLCQNIRVEIVELELKSLLQFSILMSDLDQISLLQRLCIEKFNSDIMTGIAISMFVPGNRNILDHVFEVLISGIHFSDYGKARLIVMLALREQEKHLLTLSKESPFTLDWCFDNIDVDENDENRTVLEYMKRFFNHRNVL